MRGSDVGVLRCETRMINRGGSSRFAETRRPEQRLEDAELDNQRRRVGTAFLLIAALAPVLTLLPPDDSATPRAVAIYFTITAIVALTSWRWWDRLADFTGPAAVAYIVAIVVLRDAEGAGMSGLGPLVLLPLFWCSLVGTRRSLGMVLVAMACGLVLPIVLIGAPEYPVTEWRRVAVWLTVAPVVGAATLELRRRAHGAQRQVTELARTDALTGCLNRRGLHEIAARELVRIRRTGCPMSVALLDLDHFKRFNDTHGHSAGDDLLRDAAAAWEQALREVDVLARWGGEEFVVLLPDTTPDAAALILERLRTRTPHGQTCSVGVASIERAAKGDDLADAIRRADSAMYEAKGAGRDRVVVAD